MFGSKQTVVHRVSDFENGASYTFAEAFLIADFLEKSYITDENNLVTESVDLEDGTYKNMTRLALDAPPNDLSLSVSPPFFLTIFSGQLVQRVPSFIRVDIKDVAQQWHTRRSRDLARHDEDISIVYTDRTTRRREKRREEKKRNKIDSSALEGRGTTRQAKQNPQLSHQSSAGPSIDRSHS
ncbi:hypothetical protein VI817_001677 [Penicillium citrinum]|nr:hypothetical protein VI817_001677 [Penicillium citrinum]